MTDKKAKDEKLKEAQSKKLPTKLDGSELEKLKKFDIDVRTLIQVLGEASLEKLITTSKLESIKSKINDLESSYLSLMEERDTFTTNLIEKYGQGIRINPETGEISR
jgi:hypothetical protein